MEFHPYLYQEELWDFCKLHNITLISYRSLGKGALLEDSKLKEIANQYQKTVAQVILRWLIQKNIPVIPKASSQVHLKENLEISTFLDEKDSRAMDALHRNKRYCGEKLILNLRISFAWAIILQNRSEKVQTVKGEAVHTNRLFPKLHAGETLLFALARILLGL